MLNRDFECLTVNGACDLTTKNIIAGSPLTYGENGYKLCGANDKFAGLSYNYYHTGKNDVTGGEWFADSGKVGVVKIAQVTLAADEIDGVKVFPFNKDAQFTVGAGLKVNAEGQLDLIDGSDTTTEPVGTVVSFDATAGVLVAYINVK